MCVMYIYIYILYMYIVLSEGVHTARAQYPTSPQQQTSSKRIGRLRTLPWTAPRDRTTSCASRRVWRATPPSTTITTANLQKNTTGTAGKQVSWGSCAASGGGTRRRSARRGRSSRIG
ncbi:hypothetical protein CRUP_022315, partial [Coryphaenoides rupestris]